LAAIGTLGAVRMGRRGAEADYARAGEVSDLIRGAGASLPLPLVSVSRSSDFIPGTIGRRFPTGRRSEPAHGFEAAGVRCTESSALAVSSQSVC
jgi:hypothetical protein